MKAIKLDKISTIAELSDLARIWSFRKTKLQNWLHYSETHNLYRFKRGKINRLHNEMIRRYKVIDIIFDSICHVLQCVKFF